MAATRNGPASVSLGSTKEIGSRLVAGRHCENRTEDAHIIDRLAALGELGMASGIDESFNIDAFVKEAQTGR